jgi:hypothetical protein
MRLCQSDGRGKEKVSVFELTTVVAECRYGQQLQNGDDGKTSMLSRSEPQLLQNEAMATMEKM